MDQVQVLAAAAQLENTVQTLGLGLAVLIGLLVFLVAGSVVLEIGRFRTTNPENKRLMRTLSIPVYLVGILVLIFTIFCAARYSEARDALLSDPPSTQPSQTESTPTKPTDPPTEPPTEPPTDPPTEPPTEPSFSAAPTYTDKSNPSNWSVKWEIIANESQVGSYQRPADITFHQTAPYFALPGIATFRGNPYRNGATYGLSEVTEEKLTNVWEREISSLPKASSGVWSGAGWTGQPLVVEWDAETRAIMNLYPEKKAKDGLVEVIYATLDGHIYFYDLETGEYTRDPLDLGMAFKGSGSLDPRGYPLMYVGSGDSTREGKKPRMFIISLIDCKVLYERGHSESFNYRSWRGFDSSPLVDAETDTLVWPGENGLLYTIKLNTSYDKAAGTLSIKPDAPVMTRYKTSLGRTLGYEASAIIVDNYIYVGDNGGMLFCIDINTMKLCWAQNIKDDLNATPVFQWEADGNGYLYLATSMEYAQGTTYIFKINASNGEIVWEKTYTDVVYDKAVSGGALSSPLLGKAGTEMEGLAIFHIARTPSYSSGTLVALNTQTGEVVWEKTMNNYAWSTPTAVYTEDNRGYVIMCDSAGKVHLLKGSTGESVGVTSVGSNVEASPIVYKNMIVVGTRGQMVYGIKIS